MTTVESNQGHDLYASLLDHWHQLLQDPLLSDVSRDTTVEELDTLIAMEHGHAYRIKIDRGPLEPLYIIASQSHTVGHLKKMIEFQLNRLIQKQDKGKHISWYSAKHKIYSRLLDDKAAMSHLGIHQDSVLHFTKLAVEKGHHKKARKWYVS